MIKVKGFELRLEDIIIHNKRKVFITEVEFDIKIMKTIINGYYLNNLENFRKVYRQNAWIVKV